MNIYVKINDIQYPASITGKMNDKEWDNRESKSIRLEMTYQDAINTFIDDIEWYIIQNYEETVERHDEHGNIIHEIEVKTESYDNSEYSIAGDIIDHRDGTVTVKMGKPTAEEILNTIVEGLML